MIDTPKNHGPFGVVNAGTSVIGIKYKDGILIAADTVVSYGGTLHQFNYRRIKKLNEECACGCSGEMADFEKLSEILDQKMEKDEIENDGAAFLRPTDYYNFIGEHNYNRRMKMDPLWVSTVFGGCNKDSGDLFLGMVDIYGLKVEGNYLVTGLAAHFCKVLLANEWKEDMTEQEAKNLALKCYGVMYYRDKKCGDKIAFTTVKHSGITEEEPVKCPTEWNLRFYTEATNEMNRPMRLNPTKF